MTTVDLNADLGESFGSWRMGDDAAMLDIVTSANIACGFHAGDPTTLRDACAAANERGVRIGAQVGYRDLAGFGRRFIDLSPDDLHADVLYQLGALDGLARVAGTRVRYVKPHGALYNAIVWHTEQALAVVRAVADFDPTLPVLGLPQSVFLQLAQQHGLSTVQEGFADRAYQSTGALVPRGTTGAVLHDPRQIADRALAMARDHQVESAEGTTVRVEAQSICVHGDTPGAVDIAVEVRNTLRAAGITVEPFCP